MYRAIFAIILSVAFISGCTQSSTVERAYFNGHPLNVRAEVEPGAFDGLLKVYINEQMVVNQRSKAFGGSSQTFNGNWQGQPVTARATKVQNMLSSYTQIDVFVNGQLIETLVV